MEPVCRRYRIFTQIWRRSRCAPSLVVLMFFLNLTYSYVTHFRPEEVPTRRLYLSAFTIGMGYLLGGAIPLIPYFFIPTAHIALIYSSILTGIVLLIFGAVKARITGAAGKGVGGYVWG